jgi:putative SOS response-associated peptidase YedK
VADIYDRMPVILAQDDYAQPMITAMANGELEIAMLAFSTFPIAVVNAGMDEDGHYSFAVAL